MRGNTNRGYSFARNCTVAGQKQIASPPLTQSYDWLERAFAQTMWNSLSEYDSSGIAEDGAAIRLFLALNAKRSPSKCSKPFRVDCFFALLADSESAFAYAAQSRTRATKLLGVAVEIRDRDRAFRGTLNFVQLIRARIHCDTVSLTRPSL
jgi:hypothetical protein